MLIQPGSNSPFADGAAYINNIPEVGGTTILFDMEIRNNSLYTQNPPNNGTLNLVGAFGATISNVQRGTGFDVYKTPGDADLTIGGDAAYAVLKRPDAPINGPTGAYLLYSVNLANGQITGGALVDGGRDFTGGFAIAPDVPEPATIALAISGMAAIALTRRGSRSKT